MRTKILGAAAGIAMMVLATTASGEWVGQDAEGCTTMEQIAILWHDLSALEAHKSQLVQARNNISHQIADRTIDRDAICATQPGRWPCIALQREVEGLTRVWGDLWDDIVAVENDISEIELLLGMPLCD